MSGENVFHSIDSIIAVGGTQFGRDYFNAIDGLAGVVPTPEGTSLSIPNINDAGISLGARS